MSQNEQYIIHTFKTRKWRLGETDNKQDCKAVRRYFWWQLQGPQCFYIALAVSQRSQVSCNINASICSTVVTLFQPKHGEYAMQLGKEFYNFLCLSLDCIITQHQ